ncbi:prepilin-type N-terminal cleavage/methylation domain-containing protein, partial [Pseudothermotoga sp.]
MRKLKNMSRGFTLIELLIVLAVIAALLAMIT